MTEVCDIKNAFDYLDKTFEKNTEALNSKVKSNSKDINKSIDELVNINNNIKIGINKLRFIFELDNKNTKELRIQINELTLKNDELKIRVYKLETENKELELEKEKRKIIMGLSDIYRKYSENIIEQILLNNITDYDSIKNISLDFNGIVSAYNAHIRSVEGKKVFPYIQQFRTVILPNIENWAKEFRIEWNWDFCVWFYDINNKRNSLSHLFYKEKGDDYKKILTDFSLDLKNEQLTDLIPDFKKYKKNILKFIDYETI